MKKVIVCYSRSGNNLRVATGVAEKLGIPLIQVTEAGKRLAIKTVLDIVFNRMPKVTPEPAVLEGYDRILFFAPVWIGQVATPLRRYLEYIRSKPVEYGLITVCGGPNPNLSPQLIKRTGKPPRFLLQLTITELLTPGTRPTIPVLTRYRLKDEEVAKFVSAVLGQQL
jgi:hypothetical protein